MYEKTWWLDHVVTPQHTFKEKRNPDGTVTLDRAGEVLQQGTNMSAANFNNIEAALMDAHLAFQLLATVYNRDRITGGEHDRLMDSEVLGETHEVKLTNTLKFPFSSSVDTPTTVALDRTRKNLYYTVEASVKSHTGEVGDIIISDKALNGFKVAYTGSGSEVTLTLRVKGGMA